MEFLALIISILKIVGIVLLIILALILLILFVLLFSSIKLKSIAKINKEIQFTLNIKYLFGIVKYSYNYEKKQSLLKIFGIKIGNREQKEIKNELEKDIQENIQENIQEDIQKDEVDIEKNIQKSNDSFEKDNYNNKKEEKENIKRKAKSYKQKDKKNDSFLRKIYKYEHKKEIFNAILDFIKKIRKAIKIKKIKLNFEYGLNNPCETGRLCGIISIILPILFKKHLKNIKIIPDFEKEKFVGYGCINIKTSIFKILLPILTFIFKKPIKKIIFKKGE